MAKGKVSRDGGESFTLPADTQSNVDPDTAIVGDASDGQEIDLDQSEDEKNWDAPPAGARQQQNRQEDRQDDQAPQFDEEDARLAYSDDPREQQNDDDQNQRPGRRSRRNARRRESQTAAQTEIAVLKQQLEQLGGVVRTLATGQSGLAANTLEGQIVALEGALRMADEEMASAVKNSDGDTYSKAQNIRDNIVGRLWGLKNRHAQLLGTTRQRPEDERNARQNGGQVEDRQPPQQIDPRIVEAVEDRFDRFCDRFPWFDPQSAEANCNIVRSIDQELAARGLQRHTPHFWEQMERRMAQYGLRPEQDGGDDGQDDPPIRQQQRTAPVSRSRPPTGSGRSTQTGRSSANNSLSEQQVALLRDEGLLEEKLTEEDVAKRDRIIARWRAGTNNLRRQGAR